MCIVISIHVSCAILTFLLHLTVILIVLVVITEIRIKYTTGRKLLQAEAAKLLNTQVRTLSMQLRLD